MTEEQERELLLNVKSLTDHMTMVDEVFKSAKLGREMVLAFQCGHSGMYFPGDYVRQWGREYGIGLGPHPVSETLDTDYYTPPARITPDVRSIEQIMHPVGVTCAQVDYTLVAKDAYDLNLLIPANNDPYMVERAKIIRAKQLVNPLSQLRHFEGKSLTEARWLQERKY